MNGPTDKQIAYIISLMGRAARTQSDAYRVIAMVMGCSTTAAMRRATKADASATISALQDAGRKQRLLTN